MNRWFTHVSYANGEIATLVIRANSKSEAREKVKLQYKINDVLDVTDSINKSHLKPSLIGINGYGGFSFLNK